MKKLFLICIVCIFISCSKTKKKAIPSNSDSIYTYLNLTENEKLSDKTKEIYFQKALNITLEQENDSIIRNNLYKILLGYYKLKKWNKFRITSNLLLQKSIISNDTNNLAKVYRYNAGYYKGIGVYDSSFYFYLKAEKLYKKLNDDLNLSVVLINKSIVQYYASDYLGADRSITQAYSFLKNLDDTQKLYEVFTMMGIISNELKDYDKAIEYYNKALKVVRENNLNTIEHQEATCLNNLGYNYQNLGNYAEAIRVFKIALNDKGLENDVPDLYSLLLDNLAYSKFKIKDNNNLPGLFYKSLRLRKKINATTLIVLSKIHLSEFYSTNNDSLSSQKFAQEALLLAKTSKNARDILASLKQSSNVDHKNSSIYSKDYIRINDSIQEIERNSQEKFARLQLETDDIIQEKDKLAEQNRSLLYFFMGTLFIGLLLFVIRAQRAKNRELLLIQAQQKANEEIYSLMISQQATIEENRVKEKKRIAQELHDGVLGRLFGARLNLDSLNKFTDSESINIRFNYLSELKNIEQDIREISHDLNREKYVLINNFVAIVNNLLEAQKNSYEASLTSNIDESIKWEFVNNTVKINLYRILQESLQNINKYANAKSIAVEFRRRANDIRLKITDDGIGFEVNGKKKGIGLQNMLSRTNECNGVFDIKSKKGKGTSIVITLPIETTTTIVK